jgi:hypothetical protein
MSSFVVLLLNDFLKYLITQSVGLKHAGETGRLILPAFVMLRVHHLEPHAPFAHFEV